MTDKALDTTLFDALQSVTKKLMDNDKALLDLGQAMTDRIFELEKKLRMLHQEFHNLEARFERKFAN